MAIYASQRDGRERDRVIDLVCSSSRSSAHAAVAAAAIAVRVVVGVVVVVVIPRICIRNVTKLGLWSRQATNGQGAGRARTMRCRLVDCPWTDVDVLGGILHMMRLGVTDRL